MFRLQNPTAPGSLRESHEVMANAIQMLDTVIKECLDFHLSEAPSLGEVLLKHHREYRVLIAWVCPELLNFLRYPDKHDI
jgi:hypothetical protein